MLCVQIFSKDTSLTKMLKCNLFSIITFLPKNLRETLLQELIDRGDWDGQAEKPDITTLLRLHGLMGNGGK